MVIPPFHSNKNQRLAWLSVVVMLGVWGNALVLFVCPHMLGGSCTEMRARAEAPQKNDHCAGKKTSSTQDHRSALSGAVATSSSECSLCIMQGAEGLAPTIIASTQNIGYEKNPPCDASSALFELATLMRWSVDLRDHSPPGSSAKIHVLINSYRI